MIRTAILGASGYVGAELLRLLECHPEFAPVRLFGDSRAGQTAGAVHPQLSGAVAELPVERFDEALLDGVDLVFAALPHGESQKVARAILDHFVFGIPELHRDAIRGAQAVAAAGCYPTAAILACKPLIDAGLIDPASLIVDAASGVSGAGRAVKEGTAFNTVEGSFSAYGLLSHRHTAEMEQELGATVLFTPHLAPMVRGILATCYATAAREMAADEPLAVLRAAYAGEPFVRVSDDPPATKWVAGSNGAVVTARYDSRTRRVVALAAIDNLGKGAAGQMIQCANLMTGLDESAGLTATGVFP